MGVPKCRLDVWAPNIQTVDSSGGLSTVQTPSQWIKCDTVEDILTNQPRGNALEGVEIKDSLFTPRRADLVLTNRAQDFRAFDTDVYTYQYETSDGTNMTLGTSRLRQTWGPFTRFFREFQQVRLVDLETHMVLFTGRVYKIKRRYEGQRGSIVELECRDALEE